MYSSVPLILVRFIKNYDLSSPEENGKYLNIFKHNFLFFSVKQISWKGWQPGGLHRTASLKMTIMERASRMSVTTGSGCENNKKSKP